MRRIGHTLDLTTLIATAEAAHARLTVHDRTCPACSALVDPQTSSCDRRRQLQRQRRAASALLAALQTRSTGA
jgi:hypothetical protein